MRVKRRTVLTIRRFRRASRRSLALALAADPRFPRRDDLGWWNYVRQVEGQKIGGGWMASAEREVEDEIAEAIAANLEVPLDALTREPLFAFREQGSGQLVNVASYYPVWTDPDVAQAARSFAARPGRDLGCSWWQLELLSEEQVCEQVFPGRLPMEALKRQQVVLMDPTDEEWHALVELARALYDPELPAEPALVAAGLGFPASYLGVRMRERVTAMRRKYVCESPELAQALEDHLRAQTYLEAVQAALDSSPTHNPREETGAR